MKLFKYSQDEREIQQVVEKAELAALMVPFTTESVVRNACEQAARYGMAAVLATPDMCTQTVRYLEDTGVAPIAVISAMEIGDNDRATRHYCVQELMKLGVRDVEIGVPVGMVLDGEFDELTDEIQGLAELLHGAEGRLILDVEQLTDAQLFGLCETAIAGNADYVRTSSGMKAIGAMNIGRATVHNVAKLYERYGGRIKIKAGGGWDFSYLEDCNEYLKSGAERVDAGPCMLRQLEQLGW